MGPLLYRPPPRWQGWAALSGAVAIHFAAVAIASIHPTEKVVDLSDIPEAVVDVSLEQQATPEPTPIDEPPPPPPPEAIPEQKSEFVEEQSTPPPKRPPSTKPVVPIARPTSTGKAAMTYKPHIEYPYEARRSKITGSGVIVVSVGPGGEVTEASMGVSCGNAILDNAATSAFRRARFNPGTAPKVKIPITFTLTGASY
jgi:protein TonB